MPFTLDLSTARSVSTIGLISDTSGFGAEAAIIAKNVVDLAPHLGHAGQVSLGHAAFVGLGAHTGAVCTVRLEWPSLLAFAAAGRWPPSAASSSRCRDCI